MTVKPGDVFFDKLPGMSIKLSELTPRPRRWNRRIRQVCAKCGFSFWPGTLVIGSGDRAQHLKCGPNVETKPVKP